jgi:hypothetical protein
VLTGGGLGEALLFDDGEKILKLAQLHSGSL